MALTWRQRRRPLHRALGRIKRRCSTPVAAPVLSYGKLFKKRLHTGNDISVLLTKSNNNIRHVQGLSTPLSGYKYI